MDKFIYGDRVRVKRKNQPRHSSRNKTLQRNSEFIVKSTSFSPRKYDGEALISEIEGLQTPRWVPFSVLELVTRDESQLTNLDREDGLAVARRTGQTIVKYIPPDPRAQYLTEAELMQGKGTPNTWFRPGSGRKPDDLCANLE
jgi:hypothetical protein